MHKKLKYIRIVHEICIAILVLIAITLAFFDLVGKVSVMDSPRLMLIENSILVILFIDYFSKLLLSDNKKLYVKRHIFDLIAIIPFNSLLRAFRFISTIRFFQMLEVFQMFKFIKLFAFVNKLKWEMTTFLKTNGFVYIILVTMTTILLGAVGIYYVESEYNHSVNSFGDALWWSIVTSTTVGYGDITPVTSLGKVIASILMITGTTFTGVYIGTITTYFINKEKKPRLYSRGKIDVSYLEKDEIEEIMKYIKFIINKRE